MRRTGWKELRGVPVVACRIVFDSKAAKRMEWLFELYEKYTAGLFQEKKKHGKKVSRKASK